MGSLAGRERLDSSGLESHEYVMKIVPTTYEDLGGTKLIAYQYTYAYRSYISFGHGGRVVPAIWFRYDLNPITVKYHEMTSTLPFFNDRLRNRWRYFYRCRNDRFCYFYQPGDFQKFE